jgi:3'(2'), 5'-bisphosphate nucleotidase
MTGRLDELDAMLDLARRAAALVLRIQAEGFEVEMKARNDPVTRADKEANTLLCDGLSGAFPGHGIVAEESVPPDAESLARVLAQERVFFVDPVDGTREFADGRPDWCVMIGLAVGGRAAAGVVAVPSEGKLFWGGGGDAFAEDASGLVRPLALRPSASPDALRAVVSRSHASPETKAVLDRLGVRHVTPCGSVGVKAARVIEGAADLYVHVSEGAKLWDACAPDAILRAAGGELVDLTGSPIDYRGALRVPGGLIATNTALVPRVLEALRS